MSLLDTVAIAVQLFYSSGFLEIKKHIEVPKPRGFKFYHSFFCFHPQIAKNTAFPVNGVYHPCNAAPEGATPAPPNTRGEGVGMGRGLVTGGGEEVDVQPGIEMGRECAERASAAAAAAARQRSPG